MPSAGEYAQPVRLRVGTGLLTRALLASAIAFVVLAALGLSAISIHLKLMTLLLLGAGLWLTMRNRPSAAANAELRLRSDGSACLTLSTGKNLEGSLRSRAWVSPALCVVSFGHRAGALRLPIFRHHQSAGEFRRLVVLLRHAGHRGRADGTL